MNTYIHFIYIPYNGRFWWFAMKCTRLVDWNEPTLWSMWSKLILLERTP